MRCVQLKICCVPRNVDRLLVINTSSSCLVKNKSRRLPATSVNNLPRFVAAKRIALGSRTVHSSRWSQILAKNRLPHLHSTPLLGGSRQNIAITFSMGKLEWLGYLTVKKLFEDIFIHFDRIHERDRQTDGQTPHDGIGLACIASRGNKRLYACFPRLLERSTRDA